MVSDHFPAVAAYRRPRPLLLRLARRAGGTHLQGDDRHQRRHPDVPLPPLHRRAGDGHPRRDVPGPGDAGGRHRGIAERSAVHRLRVAGVPRALPPAQGVHRADAQALDRGAGHLRGRVLPHRECDRLRSPRLAGSALRRRFRGGRGAARRAGRGRLYLHQRQEAGSLLRNPPAGGARGDGQGRARGWRRRAHDRDEGLVRHRPGAGDGGYPALGRARTLPGGEDGGGGPGGDGAPRRCAAGRARGEPLDRIHRGGKSTSSASPPTSRSASGTSCSTPRGRTRGGSSTSTRRR